VKFTGMLGKRELIGRHRESPHKLAERQGISRTDLADTTQMYCYLKAKTHEGALRMRSLWNCNELLDNDASLQHVASLAPRAHGVERLRVTSISKPGCT